MPEHQTVEPIAPWAAEALERVDKVLNAPDASPMIIETALELRDTIIKQSAVNFVYETKLVKTPQENPLAVVQAQVGMSQLVDELNVLVGELEQEAKK